MKSRFTLNHHFAGVITVVVMSVLAACGGGGGEPVAAAALVDATALSASVDVSGTITGFGSVIIDGVKYDDTQTSVSTDTNPAAPTAGTLTDLKLGMRVEAKLKNGVMTDLVMRASLVGPVAALDATASSFTLYGQTVKVSVTGATPTAFEGVQDFAGLVAGDWVEVHGTVDANKTIAATRIERKPQGDAAKGLRLGGVISALDTTAKTFKFNDQIIDYSVATFKPAAAVPVNGAMAAVYSDQLPTAGVLKAKSIALSKPEEGKELRVGGRISAFTSLSDFTVSGVRVNASAATLEGGVATDVMAGASVGVEGVVTGEVLKATKLRIMKTPADVKASLAGQVTDWLSATSFKVRGTTVDASTATFTGGTSADLGNGAWLVVSGTVQGDVLKATSIAFKAAPAAKPTTLKGEIRDYNATTGTFRFLGATIKLSSSVEFVGGTSANLVNGKRVEVTGTPDAEGVVLASRVEFLPELTTAPEVVVGGRISNLVTSNTDVNFKLPGMGVSVSSATVFVGGTAADLSNGVLVQVKGRYNPATKTVAAARLEIVKLEAGLPRVAGAVSEFTSLSNFRIGGQRIDASQAILSDGVAADLKVGALVEVVGTVTGTGDRRVLTATKLHFSGK
ncbi:MAG: hypothetical protein H7143_09435 [Pseudorhodobacter sp.]|nr:hypothetical protein [Rhizobacter sp.]